MVHTCEDGRLKELYQFVDLDQHVDSHFELGTEYQLARSFTYIIRVDTLTKSGEDYKPVHRLARGGKVRMWRRHYGTKT